MKTYAQVRCAYSSVSCNECPEKMKAKCSTLAEFHRIVLLPEVKAIILKENKAEQEVRFAEQRELRRLAEEKKAKDKETIPTAPSP